MKKLNLKEFKDGSYIEIIQKFMENNNGYITSRTLDMFGIHRMYLAIMQNKGLIKKCAPGVYIDVTREEDKYYIFSLNLPKVIYSHTTALYLHGLLKKDSKDIFDVTVKRFYNNSRLKKHNVFYVENNLLELGLSEVKTKLGNIVKVYDIEKSICDIIRSKNRIDFNEFKYCMRAYVKNKNKDLDKLYLYADALGIKKTVIYYISLFD